MNSDPKSCSTDERDRAEASRDHRRIATLGQHLQSRRKELGLTLHQAAEHTGTKLAYLGRLEKDGFVEPSAELLAQIAVRYELSVQRVLELAGYSTLASVCSSCTGTSSEIRHIFDGSDLLPLEAFELRRFLDILRTGRSTR